jgi:hypothetical protein
MTTPIHGGILAPVFSPPRPLLLVAPLDHSSVPTSRLQHHVYSFLDFPPGRYLDHLVRLMLVPNLLQFR